ncbi:hypothetical protein J6590_051481 [Homalodisca vitripennis]|nr:hypothetical protein J6590_051481 [Homalodisca vitripennis]
MLINSDQDFLKLLWIGIKAETVLGKLMWRRNLRNVERIPVDEEEDEDAAEKKSELLKKSKSMLDDILALLLKVSTQNISEERVKRPEVQERTLHRRSSMEQAHLLTSRINLVFLNRIEIGRKPKENIPLRRMFYLSKPVHLEMVT